MELSEWITVDDFCATRVIKGSDPNVVENRVAFIEKTPRVKLSDGSWDYGPKGCGHELGNYQPSRDWCDSRLKELGYKF